MAKSFRSRVEDMWSSGRITTVWQDSQDRAQHCAADLYEMFGEDKYTGLGACERNVTDSGRESLDEAIHAQGKHLVRNLLATDVLRMRKDQIRMLHELEQSRREQQHYIDE